MCNTMRLGWRSYKFGLAESRVFTRRRRGDTRNAETRLPSNGLLPACDGRMAVINFNAEQSGGAPMHPALAHVLGVVLLFASFCGGDCHQRTAQCKPQHAARIRPLINPRSTLDKRPSLASAIHPLGCGLQPTVVCRKLGFGVWANHDMTMTRQLTLMCA
jgi:hypothetical protein